MGRVKRRADAADWALVIVTTVTWLALFAVILADGLRTGRARLPVYVGSAPAADAWPSVRRGAARSASPLQPGDELRALDGQDLAGLSALVFYDRANRAARAQGSVSVRAVRAGQVFEVRLEPTPMPAWWSSIPFSVGVLLTAALLQIRAPGWHLARRNLVASWLVAVYALTGNNFQPLGSTFEGVLWFLSPFACALVIVNAQDFTLSARPVPSTHRLLALLVFALVLAFDAVLYCLAAPRGAVLGLAIGSSVAFSGAALAGFTRAYLRSDTLERRQLRWVLLGNYVAWSGIALAPIAMAAGGARVLVTTAQWLLALGAPLGVLVAVIGYRFLDVDRLISATASYTLVGLAALGAGVALVPGLARASSPYLGMDAATAQWGLSMALVAVAFAVHRVVRPQIDRRLFADRHARLQGFERLLADLGQAHSVEDVTRLSGERMDALLQPDSIAIYAREEGSFTPLFVRGPAAPPAFGTDSLLVRTLERRLRPLAADAAELDAFDRAALETLGAAVLVPTRRREDVVAFTCLGPKRSGDIYTPEELAYLAAVANRCSEVLLKLDDDVVIREARQMQEALRRYVPGAVADEIESGRALEASEREVTVLFVDIRGYTSLAERRAAEEIFSTVNAYTERVSEFVRGRGGAVVEFNGDGLMAVFGAPRELPSKERAAVEAAREIVGAFRDGIEVGVGIASGPAFVGNIRAADRWIWSAIGNTTNLAARLQALTRELNAAIAIDAPTREGAGYVCADFVRHEGVPIRGRDERCDVWALQASPPAV
jgi:class 3 adenylate cyclase